MPQLDAQTLSLLQDQGRYQLKPIVAGDNDGVFRAVSAQNPKASTEPMLTPHIRAYREMLDKEQVGTIVWCGNRDMVADPSPRGKQGVMNLMTY